jgi:DNA modification methylase
MSDNVTLLAGDCVEVMADMEDASVDAIVTDPPYGLEFMGKDWDNFGAGFQSWCKTWATEALRVIKPGGHLLAFGGTRTYHRMVCAIEDAGFEIRDSIHWMYGTGFPKSLDVSKAIDKAAGAEREVVGERSCAKMEAGQGVSGLRQVGGFAGDYEGERVSVPITTPTTAEAMQWSGWGTALKPRHEPIVVARKPLIGTVAANVLEHGTGALNIDGCRIDGGPVQKPCGQVGGYGDHERTGVYEKGTGAQWHDTGRWPANVVIDPDAADELDTQSGTLVSGSRKAGNYTGLGYHGWENVNLPAVNGDSGGASRFYYVAKPTKTERNLGLPNGNPHPTVKPVNLMRWLVRLVTPPGGTVLDPFLGSGTTGMAVISEGFRFIGIEKDPQYLAVAQRRISAYSGEPLEEDMPDVPNTPERPHQYNLFAEPAA